MKYLSERLSKEFGKGFDITNLRKMRQFYCAFPKRDSVRLELNWTHYRLIMRVENPKAREFYVEECIKAGWSTRQLERQIYSFFYERLLASKMDGSVRNEINILESKKEERAVDILKSPYVLEFLDLKDNKKIDLLRDIIFNLQGLGDKLKEKFISQFGYLKLLIHNHQKVTLSRYIKGNGNILLFMPFNENPDLIKISNMFKTLAKNMDVYVIENMNDY